MNNIGKVLKEIREQRKLTQADVAKKLKLHQSHVSRVESGFYEPDSVTMRKFAKLYGVPVAILIWKATGEKDVQPSKLKAFKKLKPAVDNLIAEFFK